MTPLCTGLAGLCRTYGLQALYVFGSRGAEIASRVRGGQPTSARPTADVDIGVLPDKGLRLDVRSKVRVAAALEDLLQVGRVDLVVLTECSAFVAIEVIRGELLIDQP